MPRAIRKYEATEGKCATKAEVKQLHDRVCFKAITIAKLFKQEKEHAMEALMLVTQKKSGEFKGRLAYNGKPTRKLVSGEDKSSPICFTESILLTCGIDASEKKKI